MRLSRVEIRGFKSIAEKTVLTLPGRVACIVGPNGCGKSNVIDAIRWALGEQSAKTLRASAMGDVIFSGVKGKAPSGQARVTLEFVKDDGPFPLSLEGFDSLSISRRLYRSGESIYTINDVKCRLRDITDIFLDTGLDKLGYALIEQGKIKDIIQSRPLEIRHLIEEVAEVGRFRVKRTEAEKRLEATQGNFERIQDLLSEVTRQRNTLKAQANKAQKYQRLTQDINTLTRHLSAHELGFIQGAITRLEQKRVFIKEQLDESETLVRNRQQDLDELEKKRTKLGKEIEDARAGVFNAKAKIDRIVTDVGSKTKRLEDIRKNLDRLGSRMDANKQARRDALEIVRLDSNRLSGIQGHIHVLEKAETTAEKQTDRLNERLKEIEQTYDKTNSDLFDAIGHARANGQRIASMERRYQEMKHNAKARSDEIMGMENAREALLSEALELKERIRKKTKALEELRQIEKQTRTQRDRIADLCQGFSQKMSDLDKHNAGLVAKISMLERMTGSSTNQETMEIPAGKRVGDTFRVMPGFEEMVGRSLGDALDYIVIPNHDAMPDDPDDRVPGYIPQRPSPETWSADRNRHSGTMVNPFMDLLDIDEGMEA
ncbi:MAG: AAA family ATPase, partial [Thermodesulfobacteriota bacterium]|nr:AAA family ATPase [Thermodesulfobacteriota bacterium]